MEHASRVVGQLNRALAAERLPADAIASSASKVVLPWVTGHEVTAQLGVRITARRTENADIPLTVPEAYRLLMDIEDAIRRKRRQEQIDRGQIPGALSSAETLRFMRKNPHLFR